MYRNREVYSTVSTLAAYRDASGLTPPEQVIVDRARHRIEGCDVLDLGVGGGRTTAALASRAARYVGVDYSSVMVEHCRRRYEGSPSIQFRVADAADLSFFDPASFDFAFFSYNGIDYVDHEHRRRILDEIRRVLRPGGIFGFSSHNRDYRWICRAPRLGRPSPLAAIRFVREWLNHRRVRSGAREDREYALINDPAHRFKLLTYYIRREHQIAQLGNRGFVTRDVLDPLGASILNGPTDKAPDLYYLAERQV